MSVDGPGFHVEPDVLDAASRGMEEILRDQDTSELAELPSSGIFGDPDLQEASDAFCDAWSVGVDALCDRARWMGLSLADSATAYRDAERAVRKALAEDPGMAVIDDHPVLPP